MIQLRLPLAVSVLMLMGFTPLVLAQSLKLDPNFGTDGIWYSTESFANNIHLNPDNSLVLCGSTLAVPPHDYDGIVTRIMAAGAIDLSFGNTGFTQLSFDDLFNQNYPYEGFQESIRLDDGRIVVVGGKGPYFTGLPAKAVLAILKPVGQLDPSVLDQGRKLIEFDGYSVGGAGLFKCSNGDFILWSDLRVAFAVAEKSHLALMRFHPDGTLDSSFGPNGNGQVIHLVEPASPFYGVLPSPKYKITPEDQLLICGTATINTFCVNRFNSDGSLDVSFGVGGQKLLQVGPDIQVHDLELQPDGKILVFGSSRVQGDPVFTIIRLNKDGSKDNSWANEGVMVQDVSAYDNVINMGVVQSDGKILIAGWRLLANGEREVVLARYLENGIPDADFGNNGIQALELANGDLTLKDLIIAPDQSIFLLGSTVAGITSLRMLAKFLPAVEVGTENPGLKKVQEPSVFPNLLAPGRSLTLEFELPQASHISAQLIDLQGKTVQRFFIQEPCMAGHQSRILFLNETLSAGLYHIQLNTGFGQSLLPVLLKR